MLWGRDQHLFDDNQDMVAITLVDSNRLNLFLRTHLGWLFRTRGHGDSARKLFYYPPRRIQTAGVLLSTYANAVLLIGAIVCLLSIADYSIHLKSRHDRTFYLLTYLLWSLACSRNYEEQRFLIQ